MVFFYEDANTAPLFYICYWRGVHADTAQPKWLPDPAIVSFW